MVIPPGIKTFEPYQVCKLRKPWYGLKQASRKWYEKLTSTFIHRDSIQSNIDHSLFIEKDIESFTILLVYVNDIIIDGNSLEKFEKIKAVLHHQFKIKNLGHLKYFLGLEVDHSKKGISLCQSKYCLDLLSGTRHLGSKPVGTLANPSIKIFNDNGPAHMDIPSY